MSISLVMLPREQQLVVICSCSGILATPLSSLPYWQVRFSLVAWNSSLHVAVGEEAVKFEGLPDDVVVAKAVSVLRCIFGDLKVPEVYLHVPILPFSHVFVLPFCCAQPKESHVTRWRQDEHARGSYSYVAADSSGNDYDFLAAAVSPARNGPLVPR